MCAVEADAQRVGLMVVYRAPLQRVAGYEAVGLGAVVVIELEDVVQSQWHHVVDAGLAGAEHHGEEGVKRSRKE